MFSQLFIRRITMETEPEHGSYLREIPAISHLMKDKFIELTKNITFFVGENGSGKSTLLEAIAVNFGFNAEGGSRNFAFSTNSTHSDLYKNIRLGKGLRPKDGFFLRAESFYNAASYIDELDKEPAFGNKLIDSYGGVSLHNQSHGESFLALVQNRFGSNGLYILDEPEAALSPMRIMTLMVEIDRLRKAGSQFIIATHSPILLTMPDSEIFEFSPGGISKVGYKDTEHYQITRNFLENPEKMLKYLLDE